MDGGDLQTLLIFLQLVLTVVLSVVSAQLKAVRIEIEMLREDIRGLVRRVERLETEMIRRGASVDIRDIR